MKYLHSPWKIKSWSLKERLQVLDSDEQFSYFHILMTYRLNVWHDNFSIIENDFLMLRFI